MLLLVTPNWFPLLETLKYSHTLHFWSTFLIPNSELSRSAAGLGNTAVIFVTTKQCCGDTRETSPMSAALGWKKEWGKGYYDKRSGGWGRGTVKQLAGHGMLPRFSSEKNWEGDLPPPSIRENELEFLFYYSQITVSTASVKGTVELCTQEPFLAQYKRALR